MLQLSATDGLEGDGCAQKLTKRKKEERKGRKGQKEGFMILDVFNPVAFWCQSITTAVVTCNSLP